MTSSRDRAIRLTIITAVVSLLLSAVCTAAFVLSLTGALGTEDAPSAYAQEEHGMILCVGEGQEDTVTVKY